MKLNIEDLFHLHHIDLMKLYASDINSKLMSNDMLVDQMWRREVQMNGWNL